MIYAKVIEEGIMKKASQISITFFMLALLLEFFSIKTNSSEHRLFVGVFIVLGLAFLIYTLNEYVNSKTTLLFNAFSIERRNLVFPVKEEYYLKSDQEYLWIEDSIFLKWNDNSSFKQALLGIVAAVSGEKMPMHKKRYVKFKLDQDSYVNEKILNELIQSDNKNVIESGSASTFYSTQTLIGMRCSKAGGIILVLLLIIYIVLQII